MKDVFCYSSFSLDLQLMKVTEYLLIDTTNKNIAQIFHLKKPKDVAVKRPKIFKKLKTYFISE